MSLSRVIAGLALVLAAGSLAAQAPAKPKFTAKQIADAEAKLVQANCAVHHEVLPPAVPNGPPGKGGVDIVAFPEGTSDADLAKLIPLAARLPDLKTIDLRKSTATAKGYKEVAKVDGLKALFLDSSQVDAACLRELVALKNLVWLDLSLSTVQDDDLKELADFNALRHLTLNHVPNLTPAGVAHLQQSVRLRTLHITVEADPAGLMAKVGKLTRLVELKAQPVGDAEAREIGNLTSLQVLDVNRANYHYWWAARRKKAGAGENARPAALDAEALALVRDPAARKRIMAQLDKQGAAMGITTKGFPHLMKCTDLQILKLAGHPIDVKDSGLDKLTNLQELDLSGTDFTDDGVEALGRVKTLKKIWLSATDVTNEGVKGLALSGGLELVALDHLPVTDEAVRHLSRNRRLKDLSLNNTRVAVADRSAWIGLVRLERVSLLQTNVTDATLLTLAGLRTLKSVDARMNCPNVTLAGAAALQRELMPGASVAANNCETVYWPGGGGVPVVRNTREPDLNYRNPNARTTPSPTPMKPMPPPKAPPPVVRPIPLPGSGKP